MKPRRLAYPIADENIFVNEFADFKWDELLSYFQTRVDVKQISIVKGSAKYVGNAENVLVNQFEFNNETHVLCTNFNWQHNPSHDLEWLILLHKFYFLKDLAGAYDCTQDERYAKQWVSLIDSWIAQVPDGFIDSQVTGRRLQQWLLSYHTFVSQWQSPSITTDFFARFLSSINSQTHYLCLHLTPEGNHRTLELYAIFLVAVTFPELKAASWFLAFSTEKLVENMQQDLLPDGVHRELSTDYHHTVLKNYLRFRSLAQINNLTLPQACDDLLQKALTFSCYVHKPDGYIPAINDGDCNSYLPLLRKVQDYYPDISIQYVLSKGEAGIAPKQRSKGFAESGYYLLRSDWTSMPYDDALYLFFDCAELGFGSHGHYDVLNIEVAAYGQTLVVDPGRYTYSEANSNGINWRHYFKGTSAHNTVVIDNLDQMPYQSGRPLGQQPAARLNQFVTVTGFDYVHGQVASPCYPALHERIVFFVHPEYWLVLDRLTSDHAHDYDLLFHLTSRAQSQTSLVSNATCHVINSPNLMIAQPCSPDTRVTIKSGYVSPEYGVKHEAPIIKFTKQQSPPCNFSTVLYPYRVMPPRLDVHQLPVFEKDYLCAATEVTALKISIKTSGESYEDYVYFNHTPAGQHHQFADLTCTGQMLFVRRNQRGVIVKLYGLNLDSVMLNSIDVLSQLSSLGAVIHDNGGFEFELTSSESNPDQAVNEQ